jgi:hypothetical protein
MDAVVANESMYDTVLSMKNRPALSAAIVDHESAVLMAERRDSETT